MPSSTRPPLAAPLAAALLVAAALAGPSAPLEAQTTEDRRPPRGDGDPPTLALVLSGGSGKGLAHIGALQVFDQEGVPFDVLAGTSAGSLVGSLYALGYSGRDIERIVTGTGLDLNAIFLDRVEGETIRLEERMVPQGTLIRLPLDGFRPRLQTGVAAGQRVMQLLNLYSWAFHDVDDLTTLPLPFGCNAVDLISGEDVFLTTGFLPEVVRACISLPGIYRPMEREEGLLVDGGLSHMLPIPEARRLGGDVLLGVDVTGDVNEAGEVQLTPEGNPGDMISILLSNMGLQRRQVAAAYRDSMDLVVDPDLRGLDANNYNLAPLFITRGRDAARRSIPEIQELVGSLGGPRSGRLRPRPSLAPVQVGVLEVVGTDDAEVKELVRSVLGLTVPGRLDPFQVDEAITRVYGTLLFETVLYRLLPGEGEGPARLVVEVKPLEYPDRVGLGGRWDDETGAAVLAVVELRNRIRYGSTTGFTLRLGRQAEIAGSFVTRLGVENPVTVGAELRWIRSPVRLYSVLSGEVQKSPSRRPLANQSLVYGGGFLGYALGNATLMGLRGRVGAYRETVEEYPISDDDLVFDGERFRAPDYLDARLTGRYASASLFLDAKRFDRRSFPSRGYRATVEAEFGTASRDDDEIIERLEDVLGPLPRAPGAGEYKGFQRYIVDAEGALPLRWGLSLGLGLAWVRGSGDGLPLHYLTAVGGMHPNPVFPGRALPLWGLEPQERFGPEGWTTRLRLQWEFRSDFFLTGRLDAGDAYARFSDEELAARPDLAGLSGFDLGRAVVGGGLELGWASPVGPAIAGVGVAQGGSPRFGLRIGYAF